MNEGQSILIDIALLAGSLLMVLGVFEIIYRLVRGHEDY